MVERIQETRSIFTLRLRFTDPQVRDSFRFAPGQFNMLYLYGVGEVPISIVSDPQDEQILDHTIRSVGRVTRGLEKLTAGDYLGVRGPYGRSWPLEQAQGRDIVIVTGGLGCAPVVSVINYITRRRSDYGRLTIIQGVKHSDDLIWRRQYDQWRLLPDTQVLLAADVGAAGWPFHIGPVTTLFDRTQIDPARSLSMLCGPEGMMLAVIRILLTRGLPEEAIYLSMERNMQCGLGHCGHCQIGGRFVCHDGPVFCYPEVKEWLGVKGF